LFDFVTLAELVLGPLLLARIPQLKPAPTGIVVRPDAPKLDMTVVLHGDAAVPSLTGQRPQPANTKGTVVEVDESVVFATPEALDRIAAALDEDPTRPIAVYPWQKTVKRYEALSTFFVLASMMSTGAFTVLGSRLKPARIPTGLRAARANAAGAPRVFGGGHVVAERKYADGVGDLVAGWTDRIVNARAAHPLALLLTIIYFVGAASVAIRLFSNPTWAHFGWYTAYVLSLSICIRQVGKFARLAAALYPITLAFFIVIALRASLTMRGQRARGARAASR